MKNRYLLLSVFLLSTSLNLFAQNAPVSTVANMVTTAATASLPVTVTNFTNIVGCNMKLHYDPAVMTVTAVTTGSVLAGTYLNYNVTTPGVFNFGWYTYPGMSVPDNSIVFYIQCTKVTSGVSPVTWDTDDGSNLFYDGNYFVLNDSPQSDYYIPGSVQFGSNAPITIAHSMEACPGSTMTIPVTVNSFNSIGTVNLTMNYDPAVLTFLSGINNSGFPGLTISSPSAGTITLNGSSASGITYPDNSTLFSLNFSYLGGVSPLNWYDNGISCRYLDAAGNTLNDVPAEVYYLNGQVSSSAPSAPSLSLTQPGCTAATGTITVTTPTGSGMSYSIDGTTYTNTNGHFSEVTPGTYNVTAKNSEGCISGGTVAIISPQPPAPEAPTVNVIQPSCTVPTGTITVTAPTGSGMTYSIDGTTYLNTNGIFVDLIPGNYDVTAMNADGCISEGTMTNITPVQHSMLSGKLSYYNDAGTAMSSVTINLTQDGAVVHTTATDSDGNYSFTSLCAGDYDVEFIADKAVGGINATDAAQVNMWGVGPQYSIEKVRFYAGDVITDNQLLAADAGRLLNYFLTAGNPAFIPAWTFWNAGELVSSQNPSPWPDRSVHLSVPAGVSSMVQDYYALVTGDFNRSYNPAGTKSTESSIILEPGERLHHQNGDDMNIDVRVKENLEISAVSLILGFPAEKIMIRDVTLGDDETVTVPYAVYGNELRIGWYSALPLALNRGDRLLTIHASLISSLNPDEVVGFRLISDQRSELTGPDFNGIPETIISVDAVEGATAGAGNPDRGTIPYLSGYPNPFTESLTLSYNMPDEGLVSLKILDITGSAIMTLLHENSSAGERTCQADVSALKPGFYLVMLQMSLADGPVSRSLRIVKK